MLIECIPYWSEKARQGIEVRNRCYYDEAVVDFIDDYRTFEVQETMTNTISFDTWYTTKKDSLKIRVEAAQEMVLWGTRDAAKRAKRKEDGKKAREQSIRANIAAIQPQIPISIVVRCQSYINQITKHEPLTNQAWVRFKNRLIPEVNELIAKANDHRIQSIKDKAEKVAQAQGRALYDDVLSHCPSFQAEEKSENIDDLTDSDWAALEPQILAEAYEIMDRIDDAETARLVEQTRQRARAKVATALPAYPRAVLDAIATEAPHIINYRILMGCPHYTAEIGHPKVYTLVGLTSIVQHIRNEARDIFEKEMGFEPEMWQLPLN